MARRSQSLTVAAVVVAAVLSVGVAIVSHALAQTLGILLITLAIFMRPAPRDPFRSFEEEEVAHSYQTSRGDTLDRVERTFRNLDKRLQNVESIVTRPGYEHEDEFRRL